MHSPKKGGGRMRSNLAMAVFGIFVATLLGGCHVEEVDPAPALAVGKQFYGVLESGDTGAASRLFSADFRKEAALWPTILSSLNRTLGPVTSTDLTSANLIARNGEPCYLLTYLAKRGALAEDDMLFVCRDKNSVDWLIRGSRFTRQDTGATIAGGIVPPSSKTKKA